MKVTKEQSPISLTMTYDEACLLRAMMQNPLHDDEEYYEAKLRKDIFHELSTVCGDCY